jgi:predicted Rossmann fold flavoprotein
VDSFDVIVVGAGAAGMMCAAQAGGRGRSVLLVEHASKLGERIRISGGGRCNFSNRNVHADNFLSRNRHFCRSALAQFTPQDFLDLIGRYAIGHEERDHGQLFCRDTAQDIIEVLRSECKNAKVQWAMPCVIHSVERRNGAAAKSSGRADTTSPQAVSGFMLATDRGPLACRSLVIATGGLAVPKLGASAFGYRVAQQFGLEVVPPMPALVPLALAPEVLERLQALSGVSLEVEAVCEGETGLATTAFREAMLLTHRGLSGPAVLQVSSYWQSQEYVRSNGRMAGFDRKPVIIDLLPGLDADAWLDGHRRSRARLSTLLGECLPRRFAQTWAELHKLDRPMHELSVAEMRGAIQALKRWRLMPSGTLGYAKAEVTLGGVSTADLSSKTMQATSVPGLYFIGEVVDVTGWLGGYNFQWAWSSGWAAGQYV